MKLDGIGLTIERITTADGKDFNKAVIRIGKGDNVQYFEGILNGYEQDLQFRLEKGYIEKGLYDTLIANQEKTNDKGTVFKKVKTSYLKSKQAVSK